MWEKDNKQEQGQFVIHPPSFTVWLDFLQLPILIHKPSLLQRQSMLKYVFENILGDVF